MYLTPEELRARGIEGTDDELTRYERYARELIERFTRTHFDRYTATISVSGSGTQLLILPDWLATLTTIAFDGEDVTSTYTFKLGGYALYCEDTVFPRGFRNITITGLWGRYKEVPEAVKEAVVELVKDCQDPSRTEKNFIRSERLGDYSYTRARSGGESGRTTGNLRADELLKNFVVSRPLFSSPSGTDSLGRTLTEDQAVRDWVKAL